MDKPNTDDQPLVLIGTAASKPLMQVSALHALPADAISIDASAVGVDRLSPLLQPILSTVIAKEAANPQLMQVVINGPLAQAADGNGFRAFVRENGKITEQARLFEPERLQNLVNSAAIFQLASVVVAQQHLADISRSLDEIKKQVEQIARFQQEQRKSQITGTLKHLGPMIEAIRAGEHDRRHLPQLDAIDKEMGGIADHLTAELKALSKEVKDYSEPGLFETTTPLTEKLRKAQGAASELLEQWKMCMSSRWIALSITRQLDGHSELLKARERQLGEEFDAFFAAFGPLESLKTEVASRIDKLSSLRDSRSAIQVNRISLRKWEAQTLPEHTSKAMSHIRDTQTLLLPREPTVTLLLEMVDGRCAAAYQT